MAILVLTEAELRRCVILDLEAIAAVEEGFAALVRGEILVPPVMIVNVPGRAGEIDVKSATAGCMDSFAIKMASCFPNNSLKKLPSSSGLMVLFDRDTGFVKAVLLDNGYLTDVRTGCAGAIAAKYLAPRCVRTVGVVGAGNQARYQIMALRQVRDFSRLLVYSRSPGRVQTYVREMAARLGVDAVAAPDVGTLVRESDVVVTTTSSHRPFLSAEWLHHGLHITAMGSDTEEKQELFPEVLRAADRLVCDLKSQCERLGELHHALKAGVLRDSDRVVELGQIAAGMARGRESEREITVCDLTGVGVQDTVIARLAYQRAAQLGLGLKIEG